MTLAIRWGESDEDRGGFIYFDAVSAYTQNYKGQVTKHPVDGGGNITDHFIRDNPSFSISAVITGIDISTGSYLIQDLDDQTPFNVREAPNLVSTNSTDDSVLKKFLPEVLGQFFPDPVPEIVMDDPREDLIEQVRDLLISLTSGQVFNEDTFQFDSHIELVRLLEFEGTRIRRILSNMVMTNITFKEDVSTGFALYCDMTFEQVTFSSLRKTVIPLEVQAALTNKASSEAKKGKVDSTEVGEDELPEQDDRDGERTAFGDVVDKKQFQLGQTLDLGDS